MTRGSKLLSALLALPVLGLVAEARAADPDEIPHKTSWIGETLLPEDAAFPADDGVNEPGKRRLVQKGVTSIWVDPNKTPADGMIYTNSLSDEMHREMGVYKFDARESAIRPVTELYRQGVLGSVVTGDELYLYADFTRLKRVGNEYVEDGTFLVRFDPALSHSSGSIAMSAFETGEPVASLINAGRRLSGKPGGAVAGLGFVFVSRPDANRIVVYERGKMTNVGETVTTNPGRMAFQKSTNRLFVLADDAAGQRVLQVWQVQQTGAMTLHTTVRDIGTKPVAVAVSDNRLFIADNGTQQVRIHAACGCNYLLIDRLGQPGGVLAAGGFYANDRFDNLTDVAVDSAGNIHVAGNGQGPSGWFDIRRFTSAKVFQGKVVGLVRQDNVVADPANPSELYSAFHKYTMDYSQQVPGQEWSFDRTQLTVNREACPHDGRNNIPGVGTYQAVPLAVRNLTDSGGVTRKYLFVRPASNAYWMLGIYRFGDDGMARPAVLFSEGMWPWPDGTPSGPGRKKWTDDGDCVVERATEIEDVDGIGNYPSYTTSVDQRGNMWAIGSTVKQIHFLPMTGIDKKGIPQYGTAQIVQLPEVDMTRIEQAHYDDQAHAMYLYGYRGEPTNPTYVLARYGNFDTNRQLDWQVVMPYTPCWNQGDNTCRPYALAAVGNRVYVADAGVPAGQRSGRVRTFSADSGAYRGSLYPGPETPHGVGLLDVATSGMTATALPNGEHAIFREDDGRTRVLMYRYQPTGP